jgi:hypothetical protein
MYKHLNNDFGKQKRKSEMEKTNPNNMVMLNMLMMLSMLNSTACAVNSRCYKMMMMVMMMMM